MKLTHEQLVFLHSLLDGQEQDKWVEAANLVLLSAGISEKVS